MNTVLRIEDSEVDRACAGIVSKDRTQNGKA